MMTTTSPNPFTIYIDGACPLCRREGDFLRRLDKGRGRLALVDIADPAFDPAPLGCSYDDVMGSIHGQMPDGSVISGMEVFRQAYSRVGFGWLINWTRWPIARPLTDRLYALFARNRMRFTFRSSCESGRCRVPSAKPAR